MRAELVARASFPPKSFARRLPGVGWLVQTPGPEVVVTGEDLVERVRFPLPSGWRASHWVAPDLHFAAVSERDRVLAIDRRGRVVWQYTHHPWGGGDSESGSCWVSADGSQVWATTPTASGPDQWLVFDASDGRILGASQLQCMAAGSHPVPHPDGRHVGLSVGEGQDGAELYWGHWQHGRPVVARLDDRSRVLIDVLPSGGQYLTTPHSDSDGTVAVHEFPGGRVLARISNSAVLREGDWFDYTAGYVTEHLIIVGSAEEQAHLLLAPDTLALIGRVEYPPGHTKECITPTGCGTWLTSDYVSGRHELWRLAEDA
jgi:hypothetical protein